MNKEKLKSIIENHKSWLMSNEGERADLNYADLHRADLRYASLAGADLSYARLLGADLTGADLTGANLQGANLKEANLRGADLRGASLQRADLKGADLTDVQYDETTAFFAMQCPEEGSFIAWKKCQSNVIVKLLIPEDAKRSSATTRICRASKAVVLEVIGAVKGISINNKNVVYEVGKEMIPESFDEDRWKEYASGIHFFITRKEAEDY